MVMGVGVEVVGATGGVGTGVAGAGGGRPAEVGATDPVEGHQLGFALCYWQTISGQQLYMLLQLEIPECWTHAACWLPSLLLLLFTAWIHRPTNATTPTSGTDTQNLVPSLNRWPLAWPACGTCSSSGTMGGAHLNARLATGVSRWYMV
jgi:hypothetical protein